MCNEEAIVDKVWYCDPKNKLYIEVLMCGKCMSKDLAKTLIEGL